MGQDTCTISLVSMLRAVSAPPHKHPVTQRSLTILVGKRRRLLD